ncbi:unnamed protein product [Merluccius merluccius]
MATYRDSDSAAAAAAAPLSLFHPPDVLRDWWLPLFRSALGCSLLSLLRRCCDSEGCMRCGGGGGVIHKLLPCIHPVQAA